MQKAFKIKSFVDLNKIKPFDTITLTYDERYKRRILMKSDNGLEFLLDLQKTTELRTGNFIELDDGKLLQIIAAPEKLMKATSNNQLLVMKGAWHIGNRHLPCEIDIESLTLHYDHVIKEMLENLGLVVEVIYQPFNPEGGAYGETRTSGHKH